MSFTREYLESDVTVASIPGGNRLLAALAGLPVHESPVLRYDEMYIGQGTQGLVVGEKRHLMWRMKMLDLNFECRDTARRHIEKTWLRLFGEPHPEVSPF